MHQACSNVQMQSSDAEFCGEDAGFLLMTLDMKTIFVQGCRTVYQNSSVSQVLLEVSRNKMGVLTCFSRNRMSSSC